MHIRAIASTTGSDVYVNREASGCRRIRVRTTPLASFRLARTSVGLGEHGFEFGNAGECRFFFRQRIVRALRFVIRALLR